MSFIIDAGGAALSSTAFARQNVEAVGFLSLFYLQHHRGEKNHSLRARRVCEETNHERQGKEERQDERLRRRERERERDGDGERESLRESWREFARERDGDGKRRWRERERARGKMKRERERQRESVECVLFKMNNSPTHRPHPSCVLPTLLCIFCISFVLVPDCLAGLEVNSRPE